VLMDERRLRVTRLPHIVDGWKLFEVQRHQAAISSASARVGATHIATSSPT
jgi:hypothetical protein